MRCTKSQRSAFRLGSRVLDVTVFTHSLFYLGILTNLFINVNFHFYFKSPKVSLINTLRRVHRSTRSVLIRLKISNASRGEPKFWRLEIDTLRACSTFSGFAFHIRGKSELFLRMLNNIVFVLMNSPIFFN
jgi:hypothetical protein